MPYRSREEQRRIYQSLEWQIARAVARERDGHRCQKCGRAGRMHVHHKKPLSRGGAPYDLSNLETLCWLCHRKVHGATTRGKPNMAARRARSERGRWRERLAKM